MTYPMYPNNYNPMYSPNFVYQAPATVTQPQSSQQTLSTQPIQNGGFLQVRSEDEARNYPVAPGNVVTFKIEGQPIVCEKSQGFSQLEGPRFETYVLTKREEVQPVIQEPPQPKHEEQSPQYATKEDIFLLRQDLDDMREQMEKYDRLGHNKRNKEKEVNSNERI